MPTEIVRQIQDQIRKSNISRIEQAEELEISPDFYTVYPLKFLVLSLCTFGLYELYWFHKNWQLYHSLSGKEIKPFWRALFAPIYSFALFKHIAAAAYAESVPVMFNPVVFGTLYLGITALYRLPDPFWLIAYLSFVPLLIVQVTMIRYNQKLGYKTYSNNKFGFKHVLTTIVGGALFIVILMGTFYPDA